MIYTLTLNPSLDYILELNKFELDNINNSYKEIVQPGGKGINVSIVLNNLEVDTIAMGFIGGFSGKEIQRQLIKSGIRTDFIELNESSSRINVKIIEKSLDDNLIKSETAINTCGPEVSKESLKLLGKKLDKICDNDLLIISGSIPRKVKDEIYIGICEKLKNKKIDVIIDVAGKFLLGVLKYKPFLIKPNLSELEEVFGEKINTKREVVNYAIQLRKMGARNVLVSLGKNGAILVDENGNKYYMSVPKGKIISSVGAGDSMVAGFIFAYKKYKNYEKALKFAVSAGSATAFSSSLATKDEIGEVLSQNVEIKIIE